METIINQRIQRRIVSVIVEGERLKQQAKHISDTAGAESDDLDCLNRTAGRIRLLLRELYDLLPEELLPTMATLRAIERDNAQVTMRCTAMCTHRRRRAE